MTGALVLSVAVISIFAVVPAGMSGSELAVMNLATKSAPRVRTRFS